MVREHATEKGSNDGRQAPDRTKASEVSGSLLKRDDLGDDGEDTDEETTSADTTKRASETDAREQTGGPFHDSPSERSSKDQHVDILGDRTNERTKLEQQDTDHVGCLGADKGEHLAVEENEWCLSEEEARGDP